MKSAEIENGLEAIKEGSLPFEALLAKAHPELTNTGSIELLRKARMFGIQEAETERSAVIDGIMAHAIPAERIVPLVLEERGNVLHSKAARAVLALAFTLEEQEIESYLFCTGGSAKEIAYKGKQWAKRRTGSERTLSAENKDKFDSDMMLVVNPNTLPEGFSLEAIVNQANELLKNEDDLQLRIKTSSWRGETVTWIEIGKWITDSKWQSSGHIFFPLNRGRYGIDNDFILSIIEKDDLSRQVMLIFPFLNEIASFDEIEPDYLVSGVDLDFWWKHRCFQGFRFHQGGITRSVRPAITHFPKCYLSGKEEGFYSLARIRDLTSTNSFRIFFDLEHEDPLADVLLLSMANSGTKETFQEIHRRAKETAESIREMVFIPAKKQIEETIFFERHSNSDRSTTAEGVAKYLLENLAGAINPDPYLGIQHLLSPKDNIGEGIPVYGAGYLELFFPECYALVKGNLDELLQKAEKWDWGNLRIGSREFLKFCSRKVDGDLARLKDIFTPIIAKGDPQVEAIVCSWIGEILNIDINPKSLLQNTTLKLPSKIPNKPLNWYPQSQSNPTQNGKDKPFQISQ